MMGSCRSDLRSKVATHFALFFILLVVVPTVYAHTITPKGPLSIFVGDTFDISVAGNCVVEAIVSVDKPEIVNGAGTKTEQSPVFKMTALSAVILQSGNSVIGNIGIYEIVCDDRSSLSPPSDRVDTATGDFAVVFISNDIDGLTTRVRAAGYPLISPPMVLYPREDAEVQTREMLFRDRDGVLVKLVELGVPRPEWSRSPQESGSCEK